jgi:hypothetical protein
MPSLYEDENGVIKALVDRLGHDLEPSILIGGWATFIRIGGEISLDIDLITSMESRHKLEAVMDEMSTSSHHQGTKLRATINDVHLDIYVPFESQLGNKLKLKVEILAEYPDQLSFEKWTLLTIEAHIATKMAALLDRHYSEKGQKDAREILGLLQLDEVNPDVAAEILERSSNVEVGQLRELVGQSFDYIKQILKLSKIEQRELADFRKQWLFALEKRQNTVDFPRPEL